jgi:hypothetical protein
MTLKVIILTLLISFLVKCSFARTPKTTTTSTPIFKSHPPHPQRSRLRAGYGEQCSGSVRCKSESWLSCDILGKNPNRCQCSKPDGMIYDEERQKCVAIVGERCKFGLLSGAGDTNAEAQEEEAEIPGRNKWFLSN